jgi:polysaccharide deacetylase 2 family uncharacterized protein YibQ
VAFLSLIVLLETILLLFLIPKTPSEKTPQSATQKKVSVEAKVQTKKISEPKKEIVPVIIPKTASRKVKGKIAIIIDDWGYSTSNLDILSQIKLPLTVAILPFSNYSREVAEFAHKHNYEVIIHMPMEPDDKEKVDLEPNTLMISMDEDTIIRIIGESLKKVPYAKGVNNHMGSLATQNPVFITTVFNELKNNNLYFLDSYVVSNTVCYDVSRSVGIKFARRSVFLDNDSSLSYIRGQLMKLAQESEETGQAIGIGHDRRNTLKVLKEVLPQLAQQGYKFVFVSEITK